MCYTVLKHAATYRNVLHCVETCCDVLRQVRLSLPEDDAVYLRAEQAFTPFEVEVVKLTFLHLDCRSCGDVDAVEIYRYFLVAW
jgi:hypothetical protein